MITGNLRVYGCLIVTHLGKCRVIGNIIYINLTGRTLWGVQSSKKVFTSHPTNIIKAEVYKYEWMCLTLTPTK